MDKKKKGLLWIIWLLVAHPLMAGEVLPNVEYTRSIGGHYTGFAEYDFDTGTETIFYGFGGSVEIPLPYEVVFCIVGLVLGFLVVSMVWGVKVGMRKTRSLEEKSK